MRFPPVAILLAFAVSLSDAAAPAADTAVESTIADQQSVAITVYNDGTGLVRDLRTVPVPSGLSSLVWRDVASGIVTQSVSLIDGAPDSAAWRVLEQNYQYDLMSQAKLIEKYVGKTVQIEMHDPATGKMVTKSGTLLSPDVIQVEGNIYPGIPGRLILPELPGGLISVPTLEWKLESSVSESRTIGLSYLTSGMSWQADYVAVIGADNSALDLSGWATITNNSGALYHDALLKLVAGEVHRVRLPFADESSKPMDPAELFRRSIREEGFEEKAFFEYHLYTLGRPSTLLNNEQKQIALFDPAHAPAMKRFICDGGSEYWDSGSDSQKIDVQVKLEFENRKELGLGIPLPKGTVRVYKADTDGSLQFIGEDSIEHTPTDETVRLLLGTAFDIKIEQLVAAQRRIDSGTWEHDVTVKLRNHKTEPVTVTVSGHVTWGEWSVIAHLGGDYRRKDASTLEFDVRCPPDIETVLTYTIRREY